MERKTVREFVPAACGIASGSHDLSMVYLSDYVFKFVVGASIKVIPVDISLRKDERTGG
jgi:hypothetical protein